MSEQGIIVGSASSTESGVNTRELADYFPGVPLEDLNAGAKIDVSGYVPDSNQVTPERSRQLYKLVMDAWGVSDNKDRFYLFIQLMKYYALNGATVRSSDPYYIEHGRKKYHISAVKQYFSSDLRKWLRSNGPLFMEKVCGGLEGVGSPNADRAFLMQLKDRFNATDFVRAVAMVDFLTPGVLVKYGIDPKIVQEVEVKKQATFGKVGTDIPLTVSGAPPAQPKRNGNVSVTETTDWYAGV